jgi:membrane-associated phospholipid phosphatase
VVKASVQRGRPGAFIEQIKLFNGETFNGYGFPSGHAAMSAACVAVLYYQFSRVYRKYLLAYRYLGRKKLI